MAGITPWWAEEDGLLHPTAPLARPIATPTRQRVPAQLELMSRPDELRVHYPLDPSVTEVEVAIRGGRLVVWGLSGERGFSRAAALPDNLDFSRQRIRVARTEVVVVLPRHPKAAWRRRWRMLRDWLAATVRRLWTRFTA